MARGCLYKKAAAAVLWTISGQLSKVNRALLSPASLGSGQVSRFYFSLVMLSKIVLLFFFWFVWFHKTLIPRKKWETKDFVFA